MSTPGRLQVATHHRVKGGQVFVRVALKGRGVRRVPQGGIPSAWLASSYSYRDWAEYSRANLNGRLIDGGKLMANVEHIAFAATRVKQFEGVFSVDLFAQAIHVDLDRV